MERQFRQGTFAALMFITSLSAASAADPGFYVGATASRVEQELGRNFGIAPPILIIVPPPSGGFFPVLPPVFGGIVGGAFSPIGFPDRVEVDDSDAGWSIALGYRVNQYFAAEVSYMNFGEASRTEHFQLVTIPEIPAREIIQSYNVSVSGPAASVLGSYPLSTNWQVFARAGVLFADQETKAAVTITPGSTTRRKDTFSDEVVMAGAGVQWSFASRWTARLEYQRTDELRKNAIGGESRIDQTSLSVLFNL